MLREGKKHRFRRSMYNTANQWRYYLLYGKIIRNWLILWPRRTVEWRALFVSTNWTSAFNKGVFSGVWPALYKNKPRYSFIPSVAYPSGHFPLSILCISALCSVGIFEQLRQGSTYNSAFEKTINFLFLLPFVLRSVKIVIYLVYNLVQLGFGQNDHIGSKYSLRKCFSFSWTNIGIKISKKIKWVIFIFK